MSLMRTLLSALALAAGSASVFAEPITIVDQRDRTVTLEGEVERVVTIPIPAASMFMAVDGGADHTGA